MNLNLSVLLGWAKEDGFTGDATVDAVRSFLIAKKIPIEDDGGKSIDLATATIVDDLQKTAPKARKLAAAAVVAAATATAADPVDLDAKIKAAVAEATRALKPETLPNGRPNLSTGTTVEVKSVYQDNYERKIKQGNACFRNFATARAFTLSMLSKGSEAKKDHVAAREFAKQHDEFCERSGLMFRAMSTTSATGGQALVDPAYNQDLVWNVKEYGQVAKLLKQVTANSDVVTRKRRTGGLTVYYPNQNAAITESNPTYDNIELRSKDAMTLTQMSIQFTDDSAVNEMDEVGKEIVVALSKAQEDAIILGDGTATYGGVLGFIPKYGTTIGNTGYIVTGGGDASAHTLANLDETMGRCPSYARANAVWVCSPEYAATIFSRLAGAVGGMLFREVQGFGYIQTFKGRPIIESNSMPGTTAQTANSGDNVDVLYGDFSKAATLFDRMSVQIDTDSSIYFDKYAVAVRGVLRYDVNVHDIGNSTTAGPVVSLWQT